MALVTYPRDMLSAKVLQTDIGVRYVPQALQSLYGAFPRKVRYRYVCTNQIADWDDIISILQIEH